jgi:signal transduction histidine kinase
MPTNRETGQFLHRTCHDLRAPLRAIRAHSELLQKHLRDGGPADRVEQSLGFILDGSRKADLLLDGIAAYSTALQIDPNSFQPTRLDVMLRSAIGRLQNTINEEGAQVTYGDMPRVNANPDRISQLFELLLRNSLDHRGPESPKVHISAARNGEAEWILSVRDNGPGVESAELETIFRPFEKLHGKGAGLGLATARAIVEAHGGRIWAEMPAEGFTIRLTLPA